MIEPPAPPEAAGRLCPLCGRRPPWRPRVCDACRSWLRGMLSEIPELYVQVLGLGPVVRDDRPYVATVDDDDGRERRVVTDLPADPVAHHLVTGPIPGAGRDPRVSGSREPGVPERLDVTAAAYRHREGVSDPRMVPATRPAGDTEWVTARFSGHEVRQEVRRRLPVVDAAGEPVLQPAGDQVGGPSVVAVLDAWTREWISYPWCPGEHLPPPTVEHLTRWLLVRLDNACDRHEAIGDFADELRDARYRLRAAAGLTGVEEQYYDGVSCPSCDELALYRRARSDRIECGNCPHLLTFEEYDRWVGLKAKLLDPADLDDEQHQRWLDHHGRSA
jgi:hypothetical protein